MPHEHQCAVCGVVWTCTDEEWDVLPAAQCGVEKAAQVNKQGPYCNACGLGIMFIRHTRHSNRNPRRLLTLLLVDEDRGKGVTNRPAGSEPQSSPISSDESGGIPEPAPNFKNPC